MKRSRALGNAFRIGGAVLFLLFGLMAAMVLLSPAPSRVTDSDNPAAVRAQAFIEIGHRSAGILLLGGGIVVALVGLWVFRYGRRHVIDLASDSVNTASRDTVLYLRDFESDRASGFGRISMSSEEEQLTKALRGIGTAIAVGRPCEDLPPIGAPRIYYDDKEWRDRVGELIRSARLVVIRTGTGDGLHWEVHHVIRCVRPEQLLVAVANEASFQAFRNWTSSIVRWPGTDLHFKRCVATSIRGFIIFDQHWSPTCIRLKRVALFRGGVFHYREFTSALKPVFQRFAA